jgi:hypothetical protein
MSPTADAENDKDSAKLHEEPLTADQRLRCIDAIVRIGRKQPEFVQK